MARGGSPGVERSFNDISSPTGQAGGCVGGLERVLVLEGRGQQSDLRDFGLNPSPHIHTHQFPHPSIQSLEKVTSDTPWL